MWEKVIFSGGFWILSPDRGSCGLRVWCSQVPYRLLAFQHFTCILFLALVFSEKEKLSVTWAGFFWLSTKYCLLVIIFPDDFRKEHAFLSIENKIMISFNSGKCCTQLCCLAGLFENHHMPRKQRERPRKVRQVDSWSKTWQSWALDSATQRRISVSKNWEHFGKLDQPLGNF